MGCPSFLRWSGGTLRVFALVSRSIRPGGSDPLYSLYSRSSRPARTGQIIRWDQGPVAGLAPLLHGLAWVGLFLLKDQEQDLEPYILILWVYICLAFEGAWCDKNVPR